MRSLGVYLKITIPCSGDIQEAVSSFLFDRGAAGVIELPSGLEAFFDGEPLQVVQEVKKYLEALQELGHDTTPDRVSYEVAPNRDWNAEWKKSYTGFAISDRIFIKPSWEAQPQRAYACLIEIDPEMAFGTGTHATTRLCLEFMDTYLKPGANVLDIGTGTGILAMAAVKLGAASVIAFDVDPVAAETAQRNAAINGVGDKIDIFAGTLDTLLPARDKFDWVLANVNRSEILKMLPLLEKLLDYPVQIILSGILREEESIIRSALEECHFQACEFRYGDEWLACRVTR